MDLLWFKSRTAALHRAHPQSIQKPLPICCWYQRPGQILLDLFPLCLYFNIVLTPEVVIFHSSEELESQISPWRQGLHRGGAMGSCEQLTSAQGGEKVVNQVFFWWEKPGSRSPTPLLPTAEVRPEESAPTLSKVHRFHLCLIWYKRREEFPCELPTYLCLAGHCTEQEVLLATIKEFEVLSKLGSRAQKMKKREHIPPWQAQGNSVCSYCVCSYCVTKDHESSEMPNPTSALHPAGSLVPSQHWSWLCRIHTCRGKNSAEALQESALCFCLRGRRGFRDF